MLDAADTYTTAQAAKVLRVDARTIRKMLDREELDGARDEAGSWRVSQASVHARLEEQRAEGRGRWQETPQEPSDAPLSAADLQVMVSLNLNYRLGRSEAGVELT